MHIRSRISPADLQRAKERRAWGSLSVCVAIGLALSAAGLLHPGAKPPQAAQAGPAPPPAMVQAPGGSAKQRPVPPPLPSVRIPEAPMSIPLAESAPPGILSGTPELPETDFPRLETLTETRDILPPVALPALTKQASTSPRPHRVPAGEATTTPPAYKNAPAPPYPPTLKAHRVEGSVRVRISVDASGRPAQVEVIEGSGYGEFDTCARDWILKHWEFTPARRGGDTIAGTVTTSVRFVLR